MKILCVGISHETASVELRERVAMNPGDAQAALRQITAAHPGAEAAILSTCNRTEVYAGAPDTAEAAAPTLEDILNHIAESRSLATAELREVSYHHHDAHAVRHLMSVASGLHSMVLGENQILSQVKDAYRLAQTADTVGPAWHHLFQSVLSVSKRVRTETGIGEGRVSVSSVAVDFAKHLFKSFNDKTVLVIGAGKMTELTLTHFMELAPGRVVVCNRSMDKAEALADKFKAETAPFESLTDQLVEADIVITCTGSTEPIVKAEGFRALMKKRRFRPLFVIDMAVPRDFDPAVSNTQGVYLYDMDDLQRAIDDHRSKRTDQIEACHAIIEPAVKQCVTALQHADSAETIKALRQHFFDLGQAETERTFKHIKTEGASPETRERIEAAIEEHTHRLINKILHPPVSKLSKHQNGADLDAQALRRLFDLDQED
jgi:glutamyl-tRNA reductase